MPRVREQGSRTDRLVMADFDRRKPAGCDQPPDLGRKLAIIVKSVGAGEQSLGRLIIGHPGSQLGLVRDIRRVDQYEVEALDDPVGPIADAELGARFEPEPPGVGSGVTERFVRRRDARSP